MDTFEFDLIEFFGRTMQSLGKTFAFDGKIVFGTVLGTLISAGTAWLIHKRTRKDAADERERVKIEKNKSNVHQIFSKASIIASDAHHTLMHFNKQMNSGPVDLFGQKFYHPKVIPLLNAPRSIVFSDEENLFLIKNDPEIYNAYSHIDRAHEGMIASINEYLRLRRNLNNYEALSVDNNVINIALDKDKFLKNAPNHLEIESILTEMVERTEKLKSDALEFLKQLSALAEAKFGMKISFSMKN